jgi:hypothetical protein
MVESLLKFLSASRYFRRYHDLCGLVVDSEIEELSRMFETADMHDDLRDGDPFSLRIRHRFGKDVFRRGSAERLPEAQRQTTGLRQRNRNFIERECFEHRSPDIERDELARSMDVASN